MRVKINHPRILGGKLYGKGVHELPDDLQNDWFFQAIQKTGDVELIEEPKIEVAAEAIKVELETRAKKPKKRI